VLALGGVGKGVVPSHSGKPYMPEKMIGTLTLNISNSLHISVPPKHLYKSCFIATLEYSKSLPPENYLYIIALASNLWNVSVYSKKGLLHYSSTIEFLLPLILIKRSYPSFRTLLLWREIVMSLIAVVARRFMQGRHADRYLGSKRVTILVSAKRPRTS
jgi:hypothetical protein